ncbi:hypothetical protein [Marinifilum caeruleilacunae]|uniref:hypothetical protein n=1 Tax=Marinifilum caeruleilacunae TaxID=2499076 RepID=UPI001491A7A6|nr:hypothetical protein [Marinifilum caeruleilacunae]
MAVFFKILLLAVFLLILAFLGFAIKLFVDKNASFTGGGCNICACNEDEVESCDTK